MKKTKLKIEDIVFWIIILAMISLALWLISGSPTDTSAIIALTMFVTASEILIWKNLFNIDRKTSIGFEKIKNELDKKFTELNRNLNKK